MQRLDRAISFGLSITVAAAACGRDFTLIGFPDGTAGSSCTGLSTDGTVCAGNLINAGGFTWNASTGLYDLRQDTGVPFGTQFEGISGSGQVSVGYAPVGGTLQAARWSGLGTFQSLGLVGAFRRSFANDASFDGSTVVGRLESSSGAVVEPFVWSESQGMRSLGRVGGSFIAEATAVSDDGNTVVGFGIGAAERGFVWTSSAGMRLLSSPGGFSSAYGISANGQYIVGTAGAAIEAALWHGDSVFNLGKPENSSYFRANGVDDAGAIVIGNSNGPQFTATVWTQARGIEALDRYLTAMGVVIPVGCQLGSCESISADGRTIAGTAFVGGVQLGYVVTVPSPASWLALGVGAVGMRRRRR